ncbi:dUMP phosphatase [Shewanella sp. NFH-SH190041]|uniref:pyrimidine 5'-nucleotidase n=1 Tax=Shewanella sp. NFH-SH190041 TaxID=2950245 RepID=UPI0021C287B4|nr:pyrimidine 5'-nucleotidase [Shewanella sp. NFH-SH190041]BDM66102.1 dUMP phosphatase [Shewanella sp. NFH-SH190041]
MPYDWILFDADETLFHFDAPRGLTLMFARHGVEFTPDDYEAFQAVNYPLWDDYNAGRIDAYTLKTTRFNHWGTRLGISTEQLQLDYMQAMADISTTLPGVDAMLQSLQGQVRLGIITNGFTELQQARLVQTGLDNVFDLMVISEQVGAAKPDLAIFKHALGKMANTVPQRVLMVGDNLQTDIRGGINAGMHTCWYNAAGVDGNSAINPTVTVSHHEQLRQWLLAGGPQQDAAN